ncbi:MAG: HesB/IscA family protein [Gammaproteobacteria bacterium]
MSDTQYFDPKNYDKEAIVATDAAKEHIKKTIEKQGHGIGIRFSTKKAGCSGYKYVVDIIDDVEVGDKVFPLTNELAIYVSLESYAYLKGMRIDYVQEGLNKRFQFHNPNAQGSCGCGESFTVEDNNKI